MSKRYYWLKLPKDFFGKYESKILLKYGTDYIVFYLMLLTVTIDSDGVFKISDSMPCKAEVLSVIFDFNEEFIEDALTKFEKMGLAERDEYSIKMLKIGNMVGSETADAERLRKKREKEKANNVQKCSQNVAECYTEKEKEKEKDIYSEKKKEKEKEYSYTANDEFELDELEHIPTLREIRDYCRENNYTHIDADEFYESNTARGWRIGKIPINDWKYLIRLSDAEAARE